ncbi:MAG: hypothetical protein R3Y57_01430 [Erysipelotrichaceae bacterium]
MDFYFGLWSGLWLIMQKVMFVPLLLYFGPEALFHDVAGFLFLSSSHDWLHNGILGFVWLIIFFAFYGAIFSFIGGQIGKQLYDVDFDYDVPLFNGFIVFLYLAGLIFPFMVASDWFYFQPWAVWFSFCFPAVVWIYYFYNAGLSAIFIILRQLYVLFLILICITILIIPVALGILILCCLDGFEDGIGGGMYIWVTHDY